MSAITSDATISQTLAGKIAVISGSCSGIGAQIARELSSRGASIVINYPFSSLRHEADAVLSSLATQSSSIAIEADISTVDGPKHLITSTFSHYNQSIDILVNNASLAINKPFEEQTLDDWDKLVNLNGRGCFLLTQSVLPHLSRKDSRIINIVSISARGPPPFQTIYAGSKGMQDSFTRCWAKELPRKYGCTVNSVSPGPTRTEGFMAAGEEMMKTLQPIIDQTPVGSRMAETGEIAYAVAFLCEPRASWINGNHMIASGGLFID